VPGLRVVVVATDTALRCTFYHLNSPSTGKSYYAVALDTGIKKEERAFDYYFLEGGTIKYLENQNAGAGNNWAKAYYTKAGRILC
jgi:hypothetical protein